MLAPFTHSCQGRTFVVSYAQGLDESLVQRALTSKLFTDWIERLERRFHLREVHFQSVDMFGPEKLGFFKIKAEAYEQLSDGTRGDRPVPGIIFMRGDAVAILVVLICGKRRYALMVRQPRLATGSFSFMETPAGMLDGEAIASAALKEMEQELGPDFRLTRKDLKLLHRPIYLSVGACDERIHLYLHERYVTKAQLASYQGQATGCVEEGESITLDVVPLRQLLKHSNGTSIIAYHAYQDLLERRRYQREKKAGLFKKDLDEDRRVGK